MLANKTDAAFLHVATGTVTSVMRWWLVANSLLTERSSKELLRIAKEGGSILHAVTELFACTEGPSLHVRDKPW